MLSEARTGIMSACSKRCEALTSFSRAAGSNTVTHAPNLSAEDSGWIWNLLNCGTLLLGWVYHCAFCLDLLWAYLKLLNFSSYPNLLSFKSGCLLVYGSSSPILFAGCFSCRVGHTDYFAPLTDHIVWTKVHLYQNYSRIILGMIPAILKCFWVLYN